MTDVNSGSATEKNPVRITTYKVALVAVAITIVMSLILYGVLLVVYSSKLFQELSKELDNHSATIDRTSDDREKEEERLNEYFGKNLDFLIYEYGNSEPNREALLESAALRFPDCGFMIADPAGTILESGNSQPELRKAFQEAYVSADHPLNAFMHGRAEDPCIEIDGYRLYGKDLKDGALLLLAVPNGVYNGNLSFLTPQHFIKAAASSQISDESNVTCAFAVNREDETIITPTGEYDLSEKDSIFRPESGDFSVFSNEKEYLVSTIQRNGNRYVSVRLKNPESRYEVWLCMLPRAVRLSMHSTHRLVTVLFLLFFISFSMFTYYLCQFRAMHPKEAANESYYYRQKHRVVGVICVLLIAVGAWYAQTLYILSESVLNDDSVLYNLKVDFDQSKAEAAKLRQKSLDNYGRSAQLITDYLSADHSRMTRAQLNRIRDIYGLRYISVYDTEGIGTAASDGVRNARFPEDPEDPSYPIHNVIYGSDLVTIGPLKNAYAGNEMTVRSVAAAHDAEGEVTGYIEIALTDPRLLEIEKNSSLENVLAESVTANGYYVSLDSETKEITWCPSKEMIGMSVERMGIEEESIRGDFFGRVVIDNVTCYATSAEISNRLVFLVHPVRNLFSNRMFYPLSAALLMVAAIIIINHYLNQKKNKILGREVIYGSKTELLGYELFHPMNAKEVTETEVSKALEDLFEERIQISTHENTSDRQHRSLKERFASNDLTAEDLRDDFIRFLMGSPQEWYAKTIEQKTAAIFGMLLSVIVFHYIVTSGLSKFELFTLMNNGIFTGKWSRGYNLLSLTENLLLIIISFFIVSLSRWLLEKVIEVGDARVETIARLMRSAIQYVAVLLVGCQCLVNFGLNPDAVIASAGFLGIAVGIGARDLLTDIVAGLFIIFEGNVSVGDIVEINGYRGKIFQIGIRVTKIIDREGNEKLINNRDMTNIINLSFHTSIATIDFHLPLSVSIDEVDRVLTEAFKDFSKRHPEALQDPAFLGIKELSGEMICQAACEVPEIKRSRIERILSREIKNALDAHDIPMGNSGGRG